MRGYFGFFVIFFALLVGCAIAPENISKEAQPAASPTPAVLYSSAANTENVMKVASAYLDAWKRDDFASMYPLLTSLSQDALKPEEFIKHYQGIAAEAALDRVDYEILSVLVNPDTAQVRYRVVLESVLVGEIARETVMNLRLEKNNWRIEWDDMLVLPELKGSNYLVMNRSGYVPARANIYDRNGRALVAQSDATAVGLLPDQVELSSAEQLFKTISELTGVDVGMIQSLYQSAPAGADWYIPVGIVSSEDISSQYSKLSKLVGLRMQPHKLRYYFDDGIAPHVVGYVSAIQPEEVDEYRRKGYQTDERVGRIGIEKWGEAYLSGKRGGALYVYNAQGRPVTRLAEASAQPSRAIYTTLERDFQLAAEKAIAGYRGAIVLLERDTGRVLAMVSSPGFDPNAFEQARYNSSQLSFAIGSDPDRPMLNRATQGQYPLGSVFKIITMAAALESGLYTADSTYQCGYFFDELPGVRLNDWTYEYFQRNGTTTPSGLISLPMGLIRSCNPFFWHIGLDLYDRGLTTAVSDMGRAFGLGSPTGIAGLDEAAGQMPDPTSRMDAVNIAIGQGDVLVTPLQVANFIAAVGNGGTLFRPQVIEKIAASEGIPAMQFEPEAMAKLPLNSEELDLIQQAMVGVIRNANPYGTAWHVFTGLDVPLAGKTGTAQVAYGAPHAWFAGYTFAEQPDKPDIAGVVLIENVGEGSDYAAPVFRRIVELYFSGQPQKLYPWESSFNVPKSEIGNIESGATPMPVSPLAP